MKKLFLSLYGEQLKKGNLSSIECKFEDYFESRVRELEKKSGGPAAAAPRGPIVSAHVENGDEDWVEPPPIPGMMKGITPFLVLSHANCILT